MPIEQAANHPFVDSIDNNPNEDTEFIFIHHQQLPDVKHDVLTAMRLSDKNPGQHIINAMVNNALNSGDPNLILCICKAMQVIGKAAEIAIHHHLSNLSKHN